MITLEDVRRVAPEAVATQGADFIYCPDGIGRCRYLPYPESSVMEKRITGCLVGVILKMLGIPDHILETTLGIRYLNAEEDNLLLTTEATDYLRVMQNYQDRGETWGYAYKQAELSIAGSSTSA